MRLLAHQVRVEQLIFWRNRSGVFFSFLFPLLLLGFFGNLGGSGVTIDGLGYREFLVPAIIALSIVSTTFQSLAISLSFHREQGVLKRALATPLPMATLLGAKVVSIVMVAALEVGILLAAGRFLYDIGWPEHVLMFVAFTVLGMVIFSALGIGLAALIPSGDSAPAITNVIYLPMMFTSGVFYDIDSMPEWLGYVGRALPLYHLVEPVRRAHAGLVLDDIALHTAILLAWGVAAALYAQRNLRWEPRFSS